MSKRFIILLSITLSLLFTKCDSFRTDKSSISNEIILEKENDTLNLLTDINPLLEDGDINAVIEIPAGTIDKWELNKSTGQIQWELIDNKPRRINYIGYPGNYGMIPMTLLSKEKGGDGDPLDILVLGPPGERNQILKSKIIGVLYLRDRSEQDDKLIAVSNDSPMYEVNSIDELNDNYKGITEIVELWFENYKGPGEIELNGYGNKKAAIDILTKAINEYQLNNTKHNIK
ncbi:inorganic diphosphatase [Winogradskyella alexanderae]|uniref:inorganic diphosphatase n=1 Tax=Winogradskyella alexanderae TaxID=2877123 RepID=A0ABS7XV71_9FLAO|nr:inorganic diphosphatase [Winogradskyella alexanderae]MCA0133925.1 inorganic diphosphatase [Winogradskyella alexanderae]